MSGKEIKKPNKELEEIKKLIGSGAWDKDFNDFPGPTYSFTSDGFGCVLTRSITGVWSAEIKIPEGNPYAKLSLARLNKKITVHGTFSWKDGASVFFDCAAYLDMIPFDQYIHKRTGMKFPPHYVYRDYAYIEAEAKKAIQQMLKFKK